jgi:hypothetical protein
MGLLASILNPKVEGLLDHFEAKPALEIKDEVLFQVQATKSGFGPWLAKLFGSKSQNINIFITPRTVSLVEGKYTTMFPTSEIYQIKMGYGKDKKLFYLGLITLITIIPPILFFFLYSRSGGFNLEIEYYKPSQSAVVVRSRTFAASHLMINDQMVNQAQAKLHEIVLTYSRYFKAAGIVSSEDI